jgi:hypothetical protein
MCQLIASTATNAVLAQYICIGVPWQCTISLVKVNKLFASICLVFRECVKANNIVGSTTVITRGEIGGKVHRTRSISQAAAAAAAAAAVVQRTEKERGQRKPSRPAVTSAGPFNQDKTRKWCRHSLASD